jgi:hypothetical protein
MAPGDGEAFRYDVCLSFAREQRAYVDEVAKALSARSVRVFYDAYERSTLWGKDLYEHLDSVYRNAAIFCVIFISKEYASKVWTSHELRSAQARAVSENEEYLLPARFDDTELPGLRPTIAYIDLTSTTPGELAGLVMEKLQSAVSSGRVVRSSKASKAQFTNIRLADSSLHAEKVEGSTEAIAVPPPKLASELRLITPGSAARSTIVRPFQQTRGRAWPETELFLSCAEEDEEFGGMIVEELGREFRVSYWQQPNRGGWFIRKIEESINSADIFLAVHSPSYLKSYWCNQERTLALQREVQLREVDPGATFIYVANVTNVPPPVAGLFARMSCCL